MEPVVYLDSVQAQYMDGLTEQLKAELGVESTRVSQPDRPMAQLYVTNKIIELMNTVDEHIPEPVRDTDKPFLMPIEDIFTITGRGTVATGRVERGTLHLNEEVEIVGISEETKKTVCTGIEMFKKLLDEARAGDNIGALLRGIQRTEIQRGQVLANRARLHATESLQHRFMY